MKKRIAGIAMAALCIATLLCVPVFAIEIPDDATVINGLGRWSPTLVYGNSYPSPGNPLSTTTLRANGYDSGNYQTITSNVTLDDQAIRFGFIKSDSSKLLDGWYYVQFQVTLQDQNGDQRGKFTGRFADICGYVGNRDSTTGVVTDGVYIPKDENFISEIRIEDEFLCSVIFGINATHYSNFNYAGLALNIPHCAPDSIQIKIAMRPIVLKSGNAIPGVTEKLTQLNNSVEELKGEINGVNTTLGAFMQQEASNGREVSTKLDTLDSTIEASKNQAHQDAQQAHSDAEQAHQDEKDTQDILLKQDENELQFIINHSGDNADDIKDAISSIIPDSGRNWIAPAQRLISSLTTTAKTSSFMLPNVTVPSIGGNPEIPIFTGSNRNVNFGQFLDTPIGIVLTTFTKGLFCIFFFKWAVSFVNWFLCLIGFRSAPPLEQAASNLGREIDRR